MSRFFVLYLPDRSWQAYLDVMRLVCEPDAQSPAHITVRGPYVGKSDPLGDWRKVKNIDVSVVGLGTFFAERQNTVFLECDSPQLPEIWWKKDHKNGTPHLTIYDGGSREFATRVFDVLGKYSWRFNFVADRLHEYVSTGPQMRLDLRWATTVSLCARCLASGLRGSSCAG